MNRYDFDERYAMSCAEASNGKIADILLAAIPGAMGIERASLLEDKNGIDWFVNHSSGIRLRIDCKVRQEDWAATHPEEDDLALETWSVCEKQIPGWTRDPGKYADYILWLWQDTGRWCLIPFPMLWRVFSDNWRSWAEQYKTRRQETPRASGVYHSECVFVPRKVLWRYIYLHFGGEIAVCPS